MNYVAISLRLIFWVSQKSMFFFTKLQYLSKCRAFSAIPPHNATANPNKIGNQAWNLWRFDWVPDSGGKIDVCAENVFTLTICRNTCRLAEATPSQNSQQWNFAAAFSSSGTTLLVFSLTNRTKNLHKIEKDMYQINWNYWESWVKPWCLDIKSYLSPSLCDRLTILIDTCMLGISIGNIF